MAEVMGHSIILAPQATNCSAPDTGNMEVLARFGTQEQKNKYLVPLLNGDIRSSFSMTEYGGKFLIHSAIASVMSCLLLNSGFIRCY